jgi:hypothetical protein
VLADPGRGAGQLHRLRARQPRRGRAAARARRAMPAPRADGQSRGDAAPGAGVGLGAAVLFKFGGKQTLASYGAGDTPTSLPARHLEFIRRARPYHQTATHVLVHATHDPDSPMNCQRDSALRWDMLNLAKARPHVSGRVVVCGHTEQRSGEVLDLGFVRCIDTACYSGRWLTALDVDSGEVIQASQDGTIRRGRLAAGAPERPARPRRHLSPARARVSLDCLLPPSEIRCSWRDAHYAR